MMNLKKHPIEVLKKFGGKYPDARFNFRSIRYIPGGYGNPEQTESNPISFLGTELQTQNLLSWLMNVDPRYEVVVDSTVYLPNGVTRFIPMMDLITPSGSLAAIMFSRVNSDLHGVAGGYIFDSGRSFHAYGDRLITGEDRVKWLGGCLLVSPDGSEGIVDTRYVGHSIQRGFEALRLTQNDTEKYLKVPTLVGTYPGRGW